jgi:hypothetical protein
MSPRRYDRGGVSVSSPTRRSSASVPPSESVVSATEFGGEASRGVSLAYARADHTHGTPAVAKVETIVAASGVQGHASNAYLGAGIPSNLVGMNGDFYINTVTLDLYVKEGGSWL